MTEAFHTKDSETPSPCDCAWQSHRLSEHDLREKCQGDKFLYDEAGNHLLNENGTWQREPCRCTAVAPRHFQRRIIGADVVCNCGWDTWSAKPGETWDNHDDRDIYVNGAL